MNFGEKLRNLRNDRKMTQKKLASLLEVTEANISKYEHGDLEPNMETLSKICRVFGVTADYLLGTGLFEDRVRDIIDIRRRPILRELYAQGLITADTCRALAVCDLDTCLGFLSSILVRIEGDENGVRFIYSPAVAALGKKLSDTLTKEQMDSLPYTRLDEVPKNKEQLKIIEDIQDLPEDEQRKIRDYITMFHRLNPSPVAAGEGSSGK